ncbi:LamG domain-containing protein [Reichenbachiella versicolor]|uniref:hypothetical protein n=1 Tax=Reichenbachiella versicolor TaxID=1821036 RepID=UPI000D6E80DC|nr:hypothetical protein [Reichenbachiella versicolor]
MNQSIILLLILPLLLATQVEAQGLFPPELKNIYASKPDSKYSDEFNGKRKNNSFDTKKWHYRESTKTGLGQGKEYVQEKDGKLICYGHKNKRKAGAIVSNNYFQYGFYAFNWKTTGIVPDARNAWHPSVWGSLNDTRRNNVPGTTGENSNWMEIDIMEFSTWSKVKTDWSSDAPCYLWVDSLNKKVKVNIKPGPSFGWKKAIMIDGKKDKYKGEIIGRSGFDQWQTWGMEYHPEYLQMWYLDSEEWVKVGHRINFSENDVAPSLRTVPNKARKPLYWYLGNLFLPQGKTPIQEEQITNSTFEVDWFHYHPLKTK